MSIESEDALIDRVWRETKEGRYKPKTPGGAPDPYDQREATRDVIKGRRATPEDHNWRRTMESEGFTWFSPDKMTRVFGPQKIISSKQRQVLDISEMLEQVPYQDPLTGQMYYGTAHLRPYTEGQWRREKPTPVSFSESDLLSLFKDTEEFANWIKTHTRQELAKKAGLIIPRGR
jgi:hypothetical protein